MCDAMVQLVQIVEELFRTCFGGLWFTLHTFVAFLITAIQTGEQWLSSTLFLTREKWNREKNHMPSMRERKSRTLRQLRIWFKITLRTACGLISSASSSSARTIGTNGFHIDFIQLCNLESILKSGRDGTRDWRVLGGALKIRRIYCELDHNSISLSDFGKRYEIQSICASIADMLNRSMGCSLKRRWKVQ